MMGHTSTGSIITSTSETVLQKSMVNYVLFDHHRQEAYLKGLPPISDKLILAGLDAEPGARGTSSVFRSG
jgi:hypothetical protein